MSTNLLIVESPNKIKKIKSFLSNHELSFEVSASCGHIRNLDPKNMSIDIENNFTPIYINSPDKKKVISQLKTESKKADVIWLAMDYDREGEAIAWHIKEVLKIKSEKIKRITFTQITKKAIIDSIANPGDIDMNMFYAQQARMLLDKLIGYKVSPILWKQYGNWKLSAGRVQSVVVKIINEREEEIKDFKSSNFYKVASEFFINEKQQKTNKKKDAILKTELEIDLKSKIELDKMLEYIPISSDELSSKQEQTKFTISSIKTTKTKRKAPPPFITSSLQQEASNKLGMSPKSTMMSAQILYENGLITYMRTDSVILSEDAHKQIHDVISSKYGGSYYNKIQYKTKSASSQEAHEAIRPTKLSVEESGFGGKLTSKENRLYKLIWNRVVASQMKPADVEITTIKVNLLNKEHSNIKTKKTSKNNETEYCFVGKFEKILFNGYLVIYEKKSNEQQVDLDLENENYDSHKNNKKNNTDSKIIEIIKNLKIGASVFISSMDCLEKYTKPPHARFTEASLIKKLDDLGIGRPSTYAGMIDKVQTKGYVDKKTIPSIKKDFINIKLSYPNKFEKTTKQLSVDGEKNKLFINPLGFMVNSYLIKNFENILDYKFTANVELLLDKISKGEEIWVNVVRSVYNTFNPTVEKLLISIKESNKLNKNSNSSSNSKYEIRELGDHPELNTPIIVMNTKYGPAVCLNYEDKGDRKYANFTGELSKMTLQKAIKLLEYPKFIGMYDNCEVYLNKRKNFYLSCNKKNYSLDIYNKNNDNCILPENITLNECKLVIDSIKKQSSSDIKISDKIIIKKGPYGFYIKYKGKNNIKIPSYIKKKYKEDYSGITLLECQTIIEDNETKQPKTKGKKKK